MNHIVKTAKVKVKWEERRTLKGTGMPDRREFLLGSVGAGGVALGGGAEAVGDGVNSRSPEADRWPARERCRHGCRCRR